MDPNFEQPSPEISSESFFAADLRAGRILEVQPFPEARRPAWKLRIDFGPEIGEKWSSAQITELYSEADLLGRIIIAVVNFPPKRIAGFQSECLVMGLNDSEGRVVLLAPERDVPIGGRVY